MFATDFNFATELTLWAVEAYRVVFEGGGVVSPCAHTSLFTIPLLLATLISCTF